MIRRVAAICRLGFGAPFRSRFVWALMALLALILATLPENLKSDGTKAGDMRMILAWTFGPAFAALAAATLWSGCSAVSCDIEEGRHIGAAVTPARPFEIWLGRWLGVVFANSIVLAAVVAAVFAQLRLRGLNADDTAATRRLDISPASIQREAEAIYAQALAQGAAPTNAPKPAIMRSIKATLAKDFLPVEPGASREWEFLTRRGDEKAPITISFSYISAMGGLAGCAGEIRVFGAADADEPVFVKKLSEEDAGRAEFSLAPGALPPGSFRVVFHNSAGGGRAEGMTALVRHQESMAAGVPGGGLVKNLALCAALLLSALSALAGIGVALGTMFSFPVAAFAGAALVCVALISHSETLEDAAEDAHTHGHGAQSEFSARLSEFSLRVSRVVSRADAPFVEARAFDRLGDGILLDARLVRASCLRIGILAPMLFGALAALSLRRREL